MDDLNFITFLLVGLLNKIFNLLRNTRFLKYILQYLFILILFIIRTLLYTTGRNISKINIRNIKIAFIIKTDFMMIIIDNRQK